nr:ATP-binding cassette domain-containing protein [Desulfohalovibrio reitneri]
MEDGGAAASFFSLLCGVLPPSKGRVLVDGLDLAGLDKASTRRQVAYVGQGCRLLRGTVLENITRFDPKAVDQALASAELLGLREALGDLPEGYNTRVGDRNGASISPGPVQRICLARALCHRPRVLLLDQVDVSMDAASRSVLYDLLLYLRGHMTVLMCGRNPRLLDVADSIHVLRRGGLHQANTEEISWLKKRFA